MMHRLLLFIISVASGLAAPDLGQRRLEGPPGAADVYVIFAINCHDWLDPDLSSAAVLRAARGFAKHGLRADFYVTEGLAYAWAEEAPGTIQELKRLGMSFGYHHRPPHPLWFDAAERRRILALPPEQAYRELEKFESERLDLTTGLTIRGSEGGYKGVTALVGAPPLILGAGAAPPHLVAFDRDILRRMGARMAVPFHSQGNLQYPLLWWQGLLARPSDFSVVRVPPNSKQRALNANVLRRATEAGEESGNFWWNVTDDPEAQEHAPARYLARKLDELPRGRISFVTCLIHEDNWYKQGNSWDATYYEDRNRRQPRTPPFTPEPRKGIRLRTPEEQARIWQWWDELVAYTANEKRIRVVTSVDLIKLVRQDDLERTYDRAAVLAAARIIAASTTKLPEFVVLDDDALSLSDCVQAFSRTLASLKPSVRVVLGPVQRPEGPVETLALSPKDVVNASRALAADLDRKRIPDVLPATVSVGGREVALESYLWAAARVLLGQKQTIEVPPLAGVGPDPARWTIKPARRQAGKPGR